MNSIEKFIKATKDHKDDNEVKESLKKALQEKVIQKIRSIRD